MNNRELIQSLMEILEFIEPSLVQYPQYIKHIKECLYHGEEGIALEDMCSYIDDNEIEISEQIFRKIEEAGRAMEMDSEQWSYVKRHISQSSKSV